MDKQRIVIFLEGGLIQWIKAEQETEVMILEHDFDAEYLDGEGVQPIKDIDGTVEDAFVSHWWIEPDPETVGYFLGQLTGRE